jgi:hypothetical protein
MSRVHTVRVCFGFRLSQAIHQYHASAVCGFDAPVQRGISQVRARACPDNLRLIIAAIRSVIR